MAYSAFEQFEITRLLKIDILGKLDLSITNSVVFLVISILFFNFLYNYSGLSKGYLVPSR
tara:strand:- start:2288 stop:2467 length:180 start_codon:yes stop_codon:yes gene_type:complete